MTLSGNGYRVACAATCAFDLGLNRRSVQTSTKQLLMFWAAAVFAIVAVVLLLLGSQTGGVIFLVATGGSIIIAFPTYRGP